MGGDGSDLGGQAQQMVGSRWEIPMTKEPNPNQYPMTKGRWRKPGIALFFWSLDLGIWDLIGICRLGHRDLRLRPAVLDLAIQRF
jgi:hypothetical protein